MNVDKNDFEYAGAVWNANELCVFCKFAYAMLLGGLEVDGRRFVVL